MAQFIRESEDVDVITYRITGKQSIERLEPLLLKLSQEHKFGIEHYELNESKSLSFVWETTCEKHYKRAHQSAQIINKLNNTQIIESKSNLAFLQLLMKCPTLTTYVAKDGKEAIEWANRHFSVEKEGANQSITTDDWWVVKASNANGGRDIYVIHKDNYSTVLSSLHEKEEYVLQKYVHRPLLYQGKKFHFRCYSMFTGDFRGYVYEKAFILTSGIEYEVPNTVHSLNADDMRRYITNLSVNKHFAEHPGQIPCHLTKEYPELFLKIQSIWKEVISACIPYMYYQRSPNHFEFFGIDIIADEAGDCWFIEANRLPGLESSKNNLLEEDEFYNDMMEQVLRIVLQPILPVVASSSTENCCWQQVTSAASVTDIVTSNSIVETPRSSHSAGKIQQQDGEGNVEGLFKNLFKWKMFVTSERKRILTTFNT